MENTEKIKIINIKDLFKETFFVYKDNWQKFGYLLILPLIFSFLLSLSSYFFNIYVPELNLIVILVLAIIYLVTLVGFFVVYLFSYISQFLLLKNLDTEIGFKDIGGWYLMAKPYFWKVLLVSIVFAIFSLLGFILLIIPGIIFMIYYAFSVYYAILENQSLETSFSKSRGLVKGYWWAVFLRFFVGLLIVYLVISLISFVFWFLSWLFTRLFGVSFWVDLFSLWYNFFSNFIGLILAPVSIIYVFKIFQSLKDVKKDI